MRIQAVVASDTGLVRKQNEDSFCVDDELGLFVVCDGMGGHAAGDVASKTAVNAIVGVVHGEREAIRRFDGTPAALQAMAALVHHALQEASRAIYTLAASDRGKHGMGTTAIALLVLGEKAVAAHVGDSRLYLARDGELHQLSTDHNFANEMVARGVMNEAEAATSPHASVLTRAVGIQPTVAVDLLAFDVLPGDTLLLCSDGLYEYARDQAELAQELSLTDLAAIPRRLVERALKGGGHDNATGLVVRALSDAPHHHERKSSVTRDLAALRELELFRELALSELVKVYGAFEPVTVERGDAVIREGEAGEHLFVIVAGCCDIARQGVTLATLGPGAHFGEMALLNRRPRSARVTACESSQLLRLDRAGFERLLAAEPAIATKILHRFAQTLSLRLDDTYMAQDFRGGRKTLGLGEYP